MGLQSVQIYLYQLADISSSRTAPLALLWSFFKPVIAMELLFGATLLTYGLIAAFDSSWRRSLDMEAEARDYSVEMKKDLAELFRNCLQAVEERLQLLFRYKEKLNLLLVISNRVRERCVEQGQAVEDMEAWVQKVGGTY